jgi:hypothetical protein
MRRAASGCDMAGVSRAATTDHGVPAMSHATEHALSAAAALMTSLIMIASALPF